MASIRRPLSPAHHSRSYQNGGSPFEVHSPTHKFLSGSNYSSNSPYNVVLAVGVRRFLEGIFFLRYSRKSQPRWKRFMYLLLLCFVLGFGLGLTPFGDVDDIRGHDLPYVMKPSTLNVQQGVGDTVGEEKVIKLSTLNVQQGVGDNVGEEKVELETVHQDREKVVLGTVNQGLETQSEIDPIDLIPQKQLIIVTPTYNRPLQAFFLSRLGQVLRLVRPPLLWIVVEMNSISKETAEILGNAGVMYRHLVCSKNMTDIKDRGVHQRNRALGHIELHRLDGIVYFADDDNVYSLEMFENMREIRRFGTWPVAMLAQSKNKAILEGPVCNGSQVIGWHTNEKSKRQRRFHVDMSGFAFNSTILWDPKRWQRPISKPIRQSDTVKEGFQETTFIEQVVEDESQMEAIPHGCSRVMNWHLHLESLSHVYPKGWLLQKNLDVDVLN